MKTGFITINGGGIAWSVRDGDLLFDGKVVAEGMQRWAGDWMATLSRRNGYLPSTVGPGSIQEVVARVAVLIADQRYILACPTPQSEIVTDSMRAVAP